MILEDWITGIILSQIAYFKSLPWKTTWWSHDLIILAREMTLDQYHFSKSSPRYANTGWTALLVSDSYQKRSPHRKFSSCDRTDHLGNYPYKIWYLYKKICWEIRSFFIFSSLSTYAMCALHTGRGLTFTKEKDQIKYNTNIQTLKSILLKLVTLSRKAI